MDWPIFPIGLAYFSYWKKAFASETAQAGAAMQKDQQDRQRWMQAMGAEAAARKAAIEAAAAQKAL